MKSVRRILPLLLSIILTSCGASTQLSEPMAVVAYGDYTHEPSGVMFPERINSFHRVNVFQYNLTGTHISVGYNLSILFQEIVATIYLLPAPKIVSIGSPDEVVATARAHLAVQVWEVEKELIAQSHPGLELIEEGFITLTHFGAEYTGRRLVFEFEDVFFGRQERLRSHLYLFCYVGKKWLFKYRFTHPARYDADQEISQFLSQLNPNHR